MWAGHGVSLWAAVQFAVFLVAVGPAGVDAGLERTCGFTLRQNNVRHGVCGSQLAELLRLVCTMHGLGYHTRAARKRRDTSESTPSDGHFLPARQARSFLFKRNVGHRGLVCECCMHRCSMRELKEYCGPVQQTRPRPDFPTPSPPSRHRSRPSHRRPSSPNRGHQGRKPQTKPGLPHS